MTMTDPAESQRSLKSSFKADKRESVGLSGDFATSRRASNRMDVLDEDLCKERRNMRTSPTVQAFDRDGSKLLADERREAGSGGTGAEMLSRFGSLLIGELSVLTRNWNVSLSLMVEISTRKETRESR
jgi:hypothetical protein